jgi:hypothetical protein
MIYDSATQTIVGNIGWVDKPFDAALAMPG